MGPSSGRLRSLGWDAHSQRHPTRLCGLEMDLGRCRQADAGQSLDGDLITLRLLSGVHDLQAVDILDLTLVDLPGERAAVSHHINLERMTQRQADGKTEQVALRFKMRAEWPVGGVIKVEAAKKPEAK